MAKKKAAKLEVAEKWRLENEIKKVQTLAKKARDEEAKKIKAAIKIKEKAKRNIENVAEKKQNLKYKAAPASTNRPSEKKKMIELYNPSAKTPVKKANTANDQL